MLISGTSDIASGDEPTTAQHGADAAADKQVGAATQSAVTLRERWVRSARRTNSSKFVGTVASFAITLLVTAFILSLFAVFLFGLPTNRSHVDGSSGVPFVKQAPRSAQGTEPKPVAARSSWIFQGR